jgi:hypothetical protein
MYPEWFGELAIGVADSEEKHHAETETVKRG